MKTSPCKALKRLLFLNRPVMILGRVSKGKGGDIMLSTAKKVLETEFPEYVHIQFHTADDHFKAVGQCIAAAALPTLNKESDM